MLLLMSCAEVITKLEPDLFLAVTSLTVQDFHYDGVDFLDGPVSFADSVVSCSPGSDVDTGWLDPSSALGIPDDAGAGTVVSLGDGGSLKLQFTDNSLTTSGDNTDDLWIFEVGAVVEESNVQISINNLTYIDLGNVSGQPTGIDIDAFIGSGLILGGLYSWEAATAPFRR